MRFLWVFMVLLCLFSSSVGEVITTEAAQPKIEEGSTTNLNNKHFQCGIRPHVKSGRIVGGKDAEFGAWPWQVLVRALDKNDQFTNSFYGGFFINENFVLTVAHWSSEPNISLAVVLGEHDTSKNQTQVVGNPPIVVKVKEKFIRPGFVKVRVENDLALLKLEHSVHFDTHIVPICLPADGSDFTRRLATVTGWGSLTNSLSMYPSILQEVQVPILENDHCQELFRSEGYDRMINPSAVCAGYPKGEKDSCVGDSGGPLVVERSDGRWQLVGIVSNGIKCAFPRLPGIYTRVTYFLPWIRNITENYNEYIEVSTE